MGLWVKDGGESEGQPVMGWIGVEPGGSAVRAAKGYITPRESGQTSAWSCATRRLMVTPKQEFVE